MINIQTKLNRFKDNLYGFFTIMKIPYNNSIKLLTFKYLPNFISKILAIIIISILLFLILIQKSLIWMFK